jgi:hypothetical protein
LIKTCAFQLIIKIDALKVSQKMREIMNKLLNGFLFKTDELGSTCNFKRKKVFSFFPGQEVFSYDE